MSVLHVACQLADNDDVIGHLLSSGALVNARDRRGRTPLHYTIDTDQPRYCGVYTLQPVIQPVVRLAASTPMY